MTEAHDQTVDHRYTVHYPPHPPRTGDPHYKDFNEFHRRTKATAKCRFAEEIGDDSECDKEHPLELHHAHIEFSLQNGVDLARLEHVYPGVSNADEVGAWIETADNLIWLCVLPGVPVLMADGSTKPIEDVNPGEWVASHDGTPCLVEAHARKRYRGETFRVGSALLTPTHRVLTRRGWLSAAEVVRQVWMHGPDVISLRCEEKQVASSVVGSVAVDMMNPLSMEQWATDPLLHDPSVLHLGVGNAVTVNDYTNVSAWSVSTSSSVSLWPFGCVEGSQAAFVRTVTGRAGTPMRVAMIDRPANQASPKMVWTTPVARRSALFSGWVHDLSIAHNHSFVAGGVAVHNCQFHHRGHGGVHVAASADYEAEKFVKGLIS